MEAFIDTEKTVTAVRHQTVRLLMSQNGNCRAAQVQLPLDADLDAWINSAKLDDIWDKGLPIAKQTYTAAHERSHRQYYRNILQAMEEVRESGGTLDMVHAAGLNAIRQVSAKHEAFAVWRALMLLNTPQPTFEEKRALVLLMMQFALTGLAAERE